MGVLLNGSVGSIRAVTTATTKAGEPNWSYIPSAGKTNKTKAELVSSIKELAKKAAMAEGKPESEQIARQEAVIPTGKKCHEKAKRQSKM